MRVTHVIAPAPWGGAESVVRALARRSGHEIVALVQARGDHPFVREARAEGLEVREIRCGRRRYLREISALEEHLRRSRPEAVHTHVYHADVVGFFAARRAGVPVVTTVHGFTGGGWRNRLYERVDAVLLRRFDAVLAVSGTLVDGLRDVGVPPDCIFEVPNAVASRSLIPRVPARQRLGLEAHGCMIGWVGRLSAEKAPDLLLEAISLVAPEIDASLVILGDGPQRDSLSRAARRLSGERRRIRFAGSVPDAASLLAAFDLIVISSRSEGTPMVLLEAMAAGVPVVAFAVGGLVDALSDEAGWLVDPGDTGALAAAITAAVRDPAERSRRAQRARSRLLDRYNMERWVQRVEQVYATVRDRSTRPPDRLARTG